MGIRDLFRRRPAVPAGLICYFKPGCCLCDQAHRALDRLAARRLATVEYVSIVGDPVLAEAYGTRIPVVLLGDEVLAEGKVSEVRLARVLAAR